LLSAKNRSFPFSGVPYSGTRKIPFSGTFLSQPVPSSGTPFSQLVPSSGTLFSQPVPSSGTPNSSAFVLDGPSTPKNLLQEQLKSPQKFVPCVPKIETRDQNWPKNIENWLKIFDFE
ncbi:MAG: hypothetical protein GY820_02895, partial [Gammaproteobacteria bacterium]|nr:hypothetical protein [Gammaproteobacteria bacterium]